MRSKISQKMLEQYIQNECSIRQIQQRQETIKTLIIESGITEIIVGDKKIVVAETERSIAKPRDKIEEIAGKEITPRLFRKIRYKSISIRRR